MNTKIYAEVLEETAMEQFESAMAQPFSVKGALMPDAHTGYSLPIGAVVATDGMIMPAWVGYDIGCGMCALKLDGINDLDIMFHSNEIFDLIYKRIPVGFNINQKGKDYNLDGLSITGTEIAEKKNHHRALGSLGGGNHFIEIGHDGDNAVWVVIHSGSRGVGHGIATYYMKLAHPEGKAEEGHHGFHVESQDGKDYIQDMNWCLDFALANRREMMERVINVITEVLDLSCYELDFSEMINRNHNHAAERDGLWIHRKGATHAEEGMMGVIPGNMRDGSFIVKGKGNPESLYSSSHGAGRVLGRKEAKRTLNMEDFKKIMKGVMKLQKDLVEVISHIKPLINIKG